MSVVCRKESVARVILDISVPIRAGMHVYPGNPGFRLERHESIADGAQANVSNLELGVHNGTHVDGALHFIDGAAGTEALPLEAFVGPAEVIDATSVETDIDEAALQSLPLGDSERVLLKTRNSRLWELPEFTPDFIRLTGSGARYLIARGVRLIGSASKAPTARRAERSSCAESSAHRHLGLGAMLSELCDLLPELCKLSMDVRQRSEHAPAIVNLGVPPVRRLIPGDESDRGVAMLDPVRTPVPGPFDRVDRGPRRDRPVVARAVFTI